MDDALPINPLATQFTAFFRAPQVICILCSVFPVMPFFVMPFLVMRHGVFIMVTTHVMVVIMMVALPVMIVSMHSPAGFMMPFFCMMALIIIVMVALPVMTVAMRASFSVVPVVMMTGIVMIIAHVFIHSLPHHALALIDLSLEVGGIGHLETTSHNGIATQLGSLVAQGVILGANDLAKLHAVRHLALLIAIKNLNPLALR